MMKTFFYFLFQKRQEELERRARELERREEELRNAPYNGKYTRCQIDTVLPQWTSLVFGCARLTDATIKLDC